MRHAVVLLVALALGLAWAQTDRSDDRSPFDVELTVDPADRTLYADDTFAIEARIHNRTDRAVRVWLTPTVSSRVALLDGPLELDLAAEATTVAFFTLEGREAGAAAFQLVLHTSDPADPADRTSGANDAAVAPATLRLTLEPVPALPVRSLSTRIAIDLAARDLPELDGVALVSWLPAGARYLPGSSLVDGEPVADPRQVEGALVFEFDGRAEGRVAYTVLHDEAIVTSDDDHALVARTPRPELLVGDEDALELLQREVPPDEPLARQRERTGAVILEPAPGSVVSSGTTSRVRVDTVLGHEVRLYVNDELVPEDRVGQEVRDPVRGRQTLTYIGVPLQVGPNELRAESEQDGTVLRDAVDVHVAGPPADIQITPVSPLVADTVEPLRFEITVTDAWGVAPRDSFVTVDVAGGAIASADAGRQQAGHQIAFRDGRGMLELAPFARSTRFEIVAAVGLVHVQAGFDVDAQARPWIVNGLASLGVHYRHELRFAASGSMFAQGAVFGDALLTLAAQAPLEPLGLYGDAYERFPVTGSSGRYGADVLSRHGAYARLERDRSYLQYGDFVTGFEGGLQTEREYTGLSGAWTAEHGFGVRAYAAYVPVRDLVTGVELASDGTSAYRLPDAPVRPGSLRIEVIKRDRLDGRLILDDGDPRLRTLVPAADYTFDEAVGLVLLARPLPLADAAGNPYLLRASYRVADVEDAQAHVQAGAQARYELDGLTLRAGASQETRGVDAFERLVSVGAAVEVGGLTADLDVGYGRDEANGGYAAALRARYDAGRLGAEADYRYQGVGYRGGGVTDDARAGHAVKLNVAYALTTAWALNADAQTSTATASGDPGVNGRLGVTYQSRGDVTLGERPIATRPRFEVGVQADAGGVRGLGSVAMPDLLGLEGSEARVTHLQGLGDDVGSVTDLGFSYRVADALEVRLTDRLEWGRRNALRLGLESSFEHADLARRACQAGHGPCDPSSVVASGRSTLTAQYEIPGGVSATAGSLRVGLDTRYPLTERISLEGSVSREVDFAASSRGATVLTAGLSYDDEALDASARYEVRFTPTGAKQVATASATGALARTTFGSIQLRYLDDPSATTRKGFSVSVAGAYRGDRLSLLTHHRGKTGALQADAARELDGDTRFSVELSNAWEFRLGHAYQLLPDDGFVDLWSIGATVHPWNGGGVSAYGRIFHDWDATIVSPGASLEVAQALGCGLYGVAGTNLWEGIGPDRGAVFGRAGAYLRLDVVFDQNWRCGRTGAGDDP
jgi:hypothetical protein